MSISIEEIRSIGIFRELEDHILEKLARSMSLVMVKPGQKLVSFNDKSTELFAILSGEARVEAYTLDGKLIALRKSGPGDLIGELSAIDGAPRSATVRAINTVRAAKMPASTWQALMNETPQLSWSVLVSLASKLREMSNRVFEFGALEVNDRILCELWRVGQSGRPVENGILVEPAPTHETIAYHVASQREVVSRTLARLESEGILEKSRGRILICNPAQLSARVSRILGETDQRA